MKCHKTGKKDAKGIQSRDKVKIIQWEKKCKTRQRQIQDMDDGSTLNIAARKAVSEARALWRGIPEKKRHLSTTSLEESNRNC